MEPLDVKYSVDQAAKVQQRHKRLTRLVAVLTSVFAFLAAISGLMSARCTTRGIIAKNEAVFKQGQVSDTWAFFQSRNIRRELTEILEKVDKKFSVKNDDRERFKTEANDLFAKARGFEAERDAWNVKSAAYLEVSKTYASAMSFLQIAVVLIPLNIILESFFLFFTGSGLGLVGMVFMILSYNDYFHIL